MTAHAFNDPDPAVAAQVAAATEAVDAAAAVPMAVVGDGELAGLVAGLAVLEAKVAALRLAVLSEADVRAAGEESAASGTDAWAARLTGTTVGVMRGGIWLANLLREQYHVTREAFAAGRINEAQARVIARAGERLPGQVTEGQRVECEQALVAKAAAGMHAKNLRRAARRMLEKVSKELADGHEARELEDEEQAAEARTELGLWDNGDGTYTGRFTIPELHGRMLAAALERLTAPRVWGRTSAGEPVADETAETMNYPERLGAAFTELVEHLPSTGHGPVAATVLVKIDLDHLLAGLGSAGLDTGVVISPGQARRLACNAGIVPAVLGGGSEVLDLGRSKRLHTETQRRALAVSHEHCAAEGCERPFAWCEIHHPWPWAAGGGTDLGNALPLCGHHHRRAHDHRYSISYLATGQIRYRRRHRTRAPAAA